MKHLFVLALGITLLSGCTGRSYPPVDRWSERQPQQEKPQKLAMPGDYRATSPDNIETSEESDKNQDNGGLGPFAQREKVSFQRQEDPTGQKDYVPPVKVAILLPLSGKSEALGQSMLQAAQLALFDLGAETFELLPRDTKGTKEGARKAAKDAISNGAQLILGPLFSESVQAVKPIARQSGRNVIAFSTDWNIAGGNVYLMGFMPFYHVYRITDYAASQGYQKIALITTNDDYGRAVERSFQNAARTNDIQIPKIIRIPVESNAINPQDLVSLSMIRPQAVLLALGGNQAREAATSLAEIGMPADRVKRLGTGLWDDPALAVEPQLAGGWFAAPSPRIRGRFEKNYADLYGVAPPRLASLAYDATALAAVLGKMGKMTPSGNYAPAYNRQQLSAASGFSGIDGVFRFNRQGLVQRGLAVLAFENRKITILDPAPLSF